MVERVVLPAVMVGSDALAMGPAASMTTPVSGRIGRGCLSYTVATGS